MNLLALDLSLTSIGWAATNAVHPMHGTYCPKDRGVVRLADVVRWLDVMITTGFTPDLVIVEGYAFGRPNQAHYIGELGGVVRLHLHRRGVPFIDLPPACRAKLATGKGNAGKEQVLVEAVRRLGYAGHSNDEADALWILQAGLIAYQLPGAIALPKAHLDGLAKVEWPLPGMRKAS